MNRRKQFVRWRPASTSSPSATRPQSVWPTSLSGCAPDQTGLKAIQETRPSSPCPPHPRPPPDQATAPRPATPDDRPVWWQRPSWRADGPAGQGRSHMDIAVGVDTDDDLLGSGGAMVVVVMAVPLLDKGRWLRPAERTDTTATSLWRQAPVRSPSLGRCTPEQPPRPGSTDHGTGTRPVKQRSDPGRSNPGIITVNKTGVSGAAGPCGLPRSTRRLICPCNMPQMCPKPT
jgi:hypothetical protein